MTVQASLCQICLETLKIVFLASRLLCLGNFVEEIPYVPVPQESVVRLRMTSSGTCYSETIELLRYYSCEFVQKRIWIISIL